MADISQTNWSETDGSNSDAAPDGAPEGMAPSGVNNTMRAMMGATKRFWSRINGTVLTTNVANAYTYTPGVAAPSLANGEIYTFRANAGNTGAATLNVGVGGAKPLRKMDVSGIITLAANDIVTGGIYQACWDSVGGQFIALNVPPATIAPASVSANIFAALHSVSACLTSEIASLSVEVDAAIRSTSVVIKADLASVSGVLTTAFNANDDSVSAVIKVDMNSVSAAHVAMLRSTSAAIVASVGTPIPAGSKMIFYNNAAPSGWTFDGGAGGATIICQAVAANGGSVSGTWTISGMNTEAAHTHSVSGFTSGPNADFEVQGASGGQFAAHENHAHTINLGTGGGTAHNHTFDGSWRPLHLMVILCAKN